MPKAQGGGSVKKGTVHHCPKQGKGDGPCQMRKENGNMWCINHTWVCQIEGHGNHVMLKHQSCGKCNRAAELDAAREASQKAENISANHPKLNKKKK
jgi:hypothetical protein